MLLIPAFAGIWTAGQKLSMPIPPAAIPLSVTGAGALVVNFSCALLLNRFQRHAGNLTRAAFLSARNDVLANVGIIGAGLVTSVVASIWPDLLVGLVIALLNANAAREVYRAARDEGRYGRP